ncbi:MAG TPA: AAA family ATPase [Actinocrinis sp.]|nr:AAA family ATPase [Actinocrinis sp.]
MRDAPGLLLVGPTGIGKSHLLALLEQEAVGQGVRVLRCAPVAAELPLPFMCLIDLLESVSDDTIACLPARQRDALRAALLRGEGPEPAGGALVHVAVLTLLRLLSEQCPLWLVVDDLPWMDGPTAQILGVVSRRVAGPRLRMVATERLEAGRASAYRELCPPGTVELAVPTMGPGELAEALELAAHGPLPASTARWISDAAQGNPLYALEIVRSLPESGSLRTPPLDGADPSLAVPGPLRALLLDRVRTLPEDVRATLVLASAAARPDLTLLATAGGEAAAAHVEVAERAGVVWIGADGHIRFDHPLLRAAVYSGADGRARRAAHARLAAAAAEPVDRARHLALANPARDEDVAQTLTVAADAARRRGAPATAAELAALAVARTPGEAGAQRAARRLAHAEYAWDAGYHEQARTAARTVLSEEHDREIRVSARIVLLKCAGQALEGEDRLIEEGLAEARGEPGLESQLRTWASTRHLLAGRLGQAAAEARRAADLADLADDPLAGIEALTELAYMQRLGGDRGAEATLARALDLAGDRGIDDVRLWEPLLTQALFHLHANRLAEAEHAVTAARARFGDQINVEDALRVQVALTDVRSRSGDCAGALRAARRAAELYEDVDGSQGPVAYALAAAESFGGSLESARDYAERGAHSARCDCDRFWYLWNLTVLGRVHLFSDEPAAAAQVLREVYGIEREMGIVDPGVGRWHPDLAEALVAEGSLDEAARFLEEVGAAATRLDRTAVLACLDRPAALLGLAEGRIGAAASLLESSVDRLRTAGLPLELARSLCALAQVEQRRRRPAQARLAATEAFRLCRAAGAVALLGWVERAAPPPAGPEPGAPKSIMTVTELRVANLAVGGSTNREIAATCYLSVKTVEATLSRVYRKLGVRSRTELARTLSA